MENEEWKDIPNYEGLYKVSNFGNIRSFNTKTNNKEPINLKQTLDRKNGYLTVSLSKNKAKKIFRVHKLVANLFIPNPNDYPCVNYKDGNKLNNNINNLEWCTYQQNIIHSWKNGLSYISEKHKQTASKLAKERWEKYRNRKTEE